MARASIAEVDAMDQDAFTATLGDVVEHSPWVADEVWRRRPFRSVEALQLAFEATIRLAAADRRIALLRAHPDLAGSEAAAGELTAASAAEQRAARLDRLSGEELAGVEALNRRYRSKFGFPFISCVREHSVASLLAWGAARLAREPEDEQATALAEVGKIVGLRLRDRIAAI